MTLAFGITCITDMVRVWSSQTPDKAALIDAERIITYAQLNERSNCSPIRWPPPVHGWARTSAIWARTPRRSSRSGPASTGGICAYVHLTDALPHTASGKVLKAALRQRLREEHSHRSSAHHTKSS
jgi:acyl-CoA synthetase (AMP-forming)/AMP-acid ligase II